MSSSHPDSYTQFQHAILRDLGFAETLQLVIFATIHDGHSQVFLQQISFNLEENLVLFTVNVLKF